MYRSGDIGRWLPDGNIELKGRKDSMVKVRGFRVEPGEIESKLLAIDRVKEGVVVVKEDRAGQKYLMAYVVVEGIDLQEVRRLIGADLPQYMMPKLMILPALPLMPNGKVDRAALPEPEVADLEYVAPGDETEIKLAAVWADILEIDAGVIGAQSNFFDLGGHSLKATRMVSLIHKALNVKVPLTQIFTTNSLADLAQIIRGLSVEEFIDIEPVEPQDHYELSYNQKRLWFIHQREPESPAYNMPDFIDFQQPVEENHMRQALDILAKRHDAFRTLFKMVEHQPVQVLLPRVTIPLDSVDISYLSDDERAKRLEAIEIEESRKLFQLDRAPLFRALLVKLTETAYRLVINMHHIVSDGWSMELIKKEIVQFHRLVSQGETVSPEPLKIQYKDFAAWHNRRVGEDDGFQDSFQFWKEKVAHGVPLLNLPGVIGGSADDISGALYRFMVDKGLKDRLIALAEKKQTTLFMVMFSLYLMVLRRYANQEDIACSIISAGRDHQSLSPVVGFFVNSLLFTLRVEDDKPFTRFLEDVHTQVLEVFQHQNYPLEPVFHHLKQPYPEIPISFNMVNMQDDTGNLELKPFEPEHVAEAHDVKFQLEPYVMEYQNGLETWWSYKKSKFNPATIEHFVKDYIKLMDYFTTNPDKSYDDFKQSGKKRKFSRRKT